MDLKRERNWGIDAMRILSMFMIVVSHVLYHGGILENVTVSSPQYYSAWFFQVFTYCAVNCYALISGFVGIHSKIRYSKLVKLWLQIVFYTLSITGMFTFLFPELISKISLVNAVFPVMRHQYWYMSAYFGMFFSFQL